MTKQPMNKKPSKASNSPPKSLVSKEEGGTIDNESNATGRPLIQITDEIIEKAEGLASQGLTQAEIAACLGMGESTFYEKVKAYPEFLESIRVGKAKGIAAMSNAVFSKGIKGDMTAATFWLRTRASHLYGDQSKLDVNINKTSNLSEEERQYADRILDELTGGKAF